MVKFQTKRSIICDPVLIILSLTNSDFAEEYVLSLKLKQLYHRIQLQKKPQTFMGGYIKKSFPFNARHFLQKQHQPDYHLTSSINSSNPKDLAASLMLLSIFVTTSMCIYSLTRYNSWVSLAFPKVTTYFKTTTSRNTGSSQDSQDCQGHSFIQTVICF